MIARAARWLRVALASSLVGLGAFAPSNAQSPSPAASGSGALSELARARVDSLLRSGHADPSWFAPDFLAQIPASQVDTIVAQLGVTLGTYQSIDGTQGDYTARFAKGTVEVLVHLDAQNRIDGLLSSNRTYERRHSTPLCAPCNRNRVRFRMRLSRTVATWRISIPRR